MYEQNKNHIFTMLRQLMRRKAFLVVVFIGL